MRVSQQCGVGSAVGSGWGLGPRVHWCWGSSEACGLQDQEQEEELRSKDEVSVEEILQLRLEAEAKLSEGEKRSRNVLLGDDGFY